MRPAQYTVIQQQGAETNARERDTTFSLAARAKNPQNEEEEVDDVEVPAAGVSTWRRWGGRQLTVLLRQARSRRDLGNSGRGAVVRWHTVGHGRGEAPMRLMMLEVSYSI
jgi:hypothetical protein